MEIGNVIKKLRRERNLTQEELAEQLNVTGAAVSKWENGGGLPDITQLAPLVSVFGISSDILLGIDNTSEDEEVQKILDEADAIVDAAIAARDDDASIQISVHISLAYMYINLGNFEKASEHANALPNRDYASQGSMLARIKFKQEDYEEARKLWWTEMSRCFAALNFSLDQLAACDARLEKREDAIKIYKSIFALDNALSPEVGQTFMENAMNFRKIAYNYIMLGDDESAMDWLEQMVDYCTERESTRAKNGQSPFRAKAAIENELRFPVFEKLHTNPRYIALLERIGALAD